MEIRKWLVVVVAGFSLSANAAFISLKTKKHQSFSAEQFHAGAAASFFPPDVQEIPAAHPTESAATGNKPAAYSNRDYRRSPANNMTPEDEAEMLRNRKLGRLSMFMGIAAVVTMPIPIVSIASLFLFPAAIVTGIIAINRSGRFKGSRKSGQTEGIIGTVVGGLGILLFITVIAVLLSLF